MNLHPRASGCQALPPGAAGAPAGGQLEGPAPRRHSTTNSSLQPLVPPCPSRTKTHIVSARG